jgi:aryl-alcohol dehydrogenase-like predicted oxidoreductase
MEQPQYNMMHRDKVEVEYDQIYKTVGLGTTIWSPLASGLLSGKYNSISGDKNARLNIEKLAWLKERSISEQKLLKVSKLVELANELGSTMPKLAIAWALKNKNVSTVILGASKVKQLEETLTSSELCNRLDDEIMERIEAILDNAPVRPLF